ncbi:hypothetical protein M673_18600 (plasmid) [Aureimonas sp. AU20]|nr:hypothetical protein M673_18600 [Aureimonas sp. AU20]
MGTFIIDSKTDMLAHLALPGQRLARNRSTDSPSD